MNSETTMSIRYFVSFYITNVDGKSGFGNSTITTDRPMDERMIRELEKTLCE